MESSTSSTTNKLQVVINNCLKGKVLRPDTILKKSMAGLDVSSGKLATISVCRIWSMLQGMSRSVRSKITRRKILEDEIKDEGKTWGELKNLTRNQVLHQSINRVNQHLIVITV